MELVYFIPVNAITHQMSHAANMSVEDKKKIRILADKFFPNIHSVIGIFISGILTDWSGNCIGPLIVGA
ncbi:hypothetical protein SDC9_187296 [bioreactor metagenome]|uniref:Uncharacterized protein n=1 Tax=bioreactor metagenome TaxID=1076179 RepID=A0A645HMI0_9ZZZZ